MILTGRFCSYPVFFPPCKITSFLVALCLSWSVGVCPRLVGAATESDTYFQAGIEFFDKSQFDKAYEQFLKAFEAEPANLDASFFLGRAAFELGDYEMAIMAFDRVLIMDPKAYRVKLELARCHLKLNAHDSARHLFDEVLATNPPEPVRLNIARLMKNMKQASKNYFLNGIFSLGFNWDDNAWTAPIDERIQTLAGEIPLSGNTATPTEDLIYTTTLALDHTYHPQIAGLTWKTSFLNYNAFYNDENDLDLLYYGLMSGPNFKTARYSVNANATVNHLDYDYGRYFAAFGAETGLSIVLTPSLAVNFGAKIDERNFFTDPGKDSTFLQFSAGLSVSSKQHRGQFTCQRAVENADENFNSYDRYAYILRYDLQLLSSLSTGFNWRHQDTEYDAASAFHSSTFGVVRRERLNDYGVNVMYRLSKSSDQINQMFAGLRYIHTDVQSNIDLYTYRKNLVSVTFSYSF